MGGMSYSYYNENVTIKCNALMFIGEVLFY